MSDSSRDPADPTAARGPAPAPGADPAGQIVALADVVRQLAQSHQTVLDALRQRPAVDPSAGPLSAAPLSAGDVRRVVADVLRDRAVERRRSATRDRYVRSKMADLPDAYRRLVPETDDEAALAAAERDVRRQFREDLRSAGMAGGGDVTGDGSPGAAGGQRPGAAVDYSVLSPLQQIAVGLKGANPARPDAPRRGGAPAGDAARTGADATTAAMFDGAD